MKQAIGAATLMFVSVCLGCPVAVTWDVKSAYTALWHGGPGRGTCKCIAGAPRNYAVVTW